MNVGFVGTGTMGLPMAGRLLDAGVALTVWNRTAERCVPLVARGAQVAANVAQLFEASDVVLLMLLDEPAVDAVLERRTPAFASRVRGRTVAMLGTTSAGYSAALEREIRAAGGAYVEAPVSGSRGPAEEGTLVGMLAGEAAAVDRVAPLLRPLCRTVVRCGPVPGALKTKLAVNHYLIVLVTALAEAAAAARASGVELARFREVLQAGPMASAVAVGKLDKIQSGDYAPQAAIRDVATIAELVREQARGVGAEAPLIEAAAGLYAQARARGLGDLDMAAVFEPGHTGGVAMREASERSVSVLAKEVVPRARTSVYPAPFAARMAGRTKRVLGDAFGLKNFGVNLTTLAPGARSALRHAHSRQDEFVYVLEGTPTLYTDAGPELLRPGTCVGFKAGTGNAHHLVNESAEPVTYLEIGDRSAGDAVTYPDDDLVARAAPEGWRFYRKDGSAY